MSFTYEQIKVDDEERLADAFCAEHGTLPNGLVTDAQFDVAYDHLVSVLKKYGTFTEGTGGGDFCSSRYVDQAPWIRVVSEDHVAPATSVLAGLEAVQSAPTPFAVAFDYYPNLILVLPPNRVFSTYKEEELHSA